MSLHPPKAYPTCPDEKILGDFLGERLTTSLAALIDAHIGSCPECQRRLEGLVGSLPHTLPQAPAKEIDVAEVPPDLPGYAPMGCVGTGGMGVVWRVRDLQFRRNLAIKVLKARGREDPGWVHRFVGEAQICGRLAHPFIVPVHGMGQLPDGRPYYTMKLVEGKTLTELLAARPDIGYKRSDFIRVFGQVCQAVAFAHGRGIIHRDLKPDNVMVGAHGEVQLMDWGLAKVLDDAQISPPFQMSTSSRETVVEEGAHTGAGKVLGTIAYMPPEQARGLGAEVDRQSDVFGLGAILCQILTGEPPYAEPSSEATWQRAIAGDLKVTHERLEQCGADPELIHLAERCLSPVKAGRPADAGEVELAVASHLTNVEERLQQQRLDHERHQVRIIEEKRRRKLWYTLGVTLLTLIGLTAGGSLYWQGLRSQRLTEASAALVAAEEQLRSGQFPGARESLTRAADRLQEAGSQELRQKHARLQAAWQFSQDLRAIQEKRTTPTDAGLFDNETAQIEYARRFREEGYPVLEGDLEEFAASIRESSVKEEILEAVDNWALVCSYDIVFVPKRKEEYRHLRDRLMTLARAIDPHPPLRDQVRDSRIWEDRDKLQQLAGQVGNADLSPRLAAILYELLAVAGGDSESLLRTFLNRYPADFWLNFDLGKHLDRTKPLEALRYYQAAQAIRPHHAIVIARMGMTLRVLCAYDEAIALYRQAVVHHPKFMAFHNNLARTLMEAGDTEGALKQYEESLRVNPDYARTYLSLGHLLRRCGRLSESLKMLERGQEIARRKELNWTSEIEEEVKLASRLIERDRRLPELLAGREKLTTAAEQIELAEVCAGKKRFGDAVEAYRRAFDMDTALATDLDAMHRFDAACTASQAAVTGELTAEQRTNFRHQALTWLRGDLDQLKKVAARDARTRANVVNRLRSWKHEPMLVTLREPKSLAQLAPAEREACQRFWLDVELVMTQEGPF